MIHQKTTSPARTPQRKKRQALIGSAKIKQQDVETELEEPVPIRYSDLYKQKKAQAEMGNMFKRKKSYPIAPDGFIPNSTLRTVFKRKTIKPAAIKAFQLRLDILENLQNQNNKNLNKQDEDDEWKELDDPDFASEPTSAKKSKGTLLSRQKDAIPDLFKRIQHESWWKLEKEEKPNLKSILVYLIEILKLKQIDSYESACYYIIEILRAYGIEPISVNQILDILLHHLTKNENDRLDICTIRTIGQFMIEQKNIIIHLLESALKHPSNDIFRLELVNAIKFITDVNNSDDIDLVLDNMSAAYEYPDENFSLKMIIKGLEHKKKIVVVKEEEKDEIHPLLKKISDERWFPRGNIPITLDSVLDAIISKLPNSSKTMIKTLTTHLIELSRVINYSKEQFDRVSNALISLLSHNDADYRLIAATNLANLNKETKAIDIALLNSFLNDPRILVRTECCDTLKKLTGIMSDTVLKDCADDIAYLQTLSEENFSLQNYLKEKNRVPTPLPPPASVEEPVTLPIEEKVDDEDKQNLIIDQIETTEDMIPIIRSRSPSPQIIGEPSIEDPSPQIIEQPSIINLLPQPLQPEPSNISSSQTLIQPSIHVEINEKRNIPIPRARKEQTPNETIRQNKQSISSSKTPIPDQIHRKRPSLLPNNTNLGDSYVKQNELTQQKDKDESESSSCPAPQSTLVNQEQINDPIQKIIEEHKQTIGFYRTTSNRSILIPHKISMQNILSDQSHIIINHDSSPLPNYPTNSMNLSDLNQNQRQLNEVEFIQLLSSLVIRGVQVHRQYEKFVPGFNFTNVLNVSQMPLHSSSTINSSFKLPLILPHRPTTRQFARIQSNINAKAAREGINIDKARSMEGALSNLLKPNREQTKSTMISSLTSHVSSLTSHVSSYRLSDTTHGSLLVQLLKSQGIYNSENYLEKIIQSYPKFILLLNTKIPQNLISIILNDPIMKQIASIFYNRQDQSSVVNSSIKRSDTKPSVPTTDDESSANGYDYTTLMSRNDQKKKFLPAIRGSKMKLPRHVIKFGFREIEIDLSESSNISPREENRLKSRKRRVYMHIMMAANENMFNRNETVKNQLGQMINNDYQAISFMPIVTRPPMCQ